MLQSVIFVGLLVIERCSMEEGDRVAKNYCFLEMFSKKSLNFYPVLKFLNLRSS